jgi:hypothetical protein
MKSTFRVNRKYPKILRKRKRRIDSSSHFGFGGGRGAVKWCGDKR